MTADTLVITQRDIRRLMSPANFLDTVELGFRASATGKASSPLPMHLPAKQGGFHAKAASISLGRDYVAFKVNGNFPDNPAKHGIPTVQGAILLADGGNGSLLAILDSIEVTIRRTAAASALAARELARSDSRTLLICGCGEQGRAHAEALCLVLPIERCLLWDRDEASCRKLACDLGAETVRDLASATMLADVIACCTTSTQPYLLPGMVKPGTFIAAVGADNPDKSEVSPELMAVAKVVTDVTAQCEQMGDLHHAIAPGLMKLSDVHADLAQILIGEKEGRSTPEEIIVFDSTGTGLQDVAAAAAIYERCKSDSSIRAVALSGA